MARRRPMLALLILALAPATVAYAQTTAPAIPPAPVSTLAGDAARLIHGWKSSNVVDEETNAARFAADLGSGSVCINKCKAALTWQAGPMSDVTFSQRSHVGLNGTVGGGAVISTLLAPNGSYRLHFALQVGIGAGELFNESGATGAPFGAIAIAGLIEFGDSSGGVIGGFGIAVMCPFDGLPHEPRCFPGLATNGAVSSLAVAF